VQQLTTDGDGSGIANENENGVDLHVNRLLGKSKGTVSCNGITSPLGKWVCSKRTNLHKKRKNKNPYKITQNLASIKEDPSSTSSQISKYSNSKFAHSALQPKLPKAFVRNGGNSGEVLPENVSTNTGFCNSPSTEPQNTPSLSRKFQKQRSMLKSGKRVQQAPRSCQVFCEPTKVLGGETIHENKQLKFTQNDGLCEEFAPELEKIRENTEVQDGKSPAEGTELDVEATALKDHLNKYEDAPNDEPINMESASWLQEEYAVAGTGDYDGDYNNSHDDEDGDDNGSRHDDDVSDGVDVDDNDERDGDVALETSDGTIHDTPQDDSSITSNGEDEMNLERSLANFQEQSGFPSTASITSLSTLNEPFPEQPDSYAQPLCPDLTVQSAERMKGEEIMNKPCVCSFRESLPKECKKVLTIPKERQLSPLYIGQRETGPFNAYWHFPQSDPMVSSGFGSFSALSQSSMPPSPNPVLRLMGKNLLVVNHEDITVEPPTPSSHYPSGFVSPNCGANQNFSSVVSQSQPAANLNQSFLISENQRPVSPSPYMPNEVIVIGDLPNINNMLTPVPVPMQLQGVSMVGPGNTAVQNISSLCASMMHPSPFFCFPQYNQAGPARPLLYPRDGNGYNTQQVGPRGSHDLGSFVPGSFAFRSPSSHVGNPLYYSHTMW
jgi:hypothetical protein